MPKYFTLAFLTTESLRKCMEEAFSTRSDIKVGDMLTIGSNHPGALLILQYDIVVYVDKKKRQLTVYASWTKSLQTHDFATYSGWSWIKANRLKND